MADAAAKYDEVAASPSFTRLYEESEFKHTFAVLHERLNQHFEDVNDRALTTHHYWAENSRELLKLIGEVNQLLHDLGRAKVDVVLDERYLQALERCRPWLSRSGGSAVPDDFEQIEVVHYEPVFSLRSSTTRVRRDEAAVELKMVGEGSYAHVYSYEDPVYGARFALKRARRSIDERDLVRFRREFEVMKSLRSPYVVEVYQYSEELREYRMEYCDDTLRAYIKRNNATLPFASRKRIALQLLYALHYVHGKDLLHRDLSLQNVLLKVYDRGVVMVKLSDFGLVKEFDSSFTRTRTNSTGTIRDPALEDFKAYSVVNEMYSIGWLLSYIFTGRETVAVAAGEANPIVQKCVDHDPTRRFQSIQELIAAVESLDVTTVGTSA